MKNIWIMLLFVCGACAFTACSDDDDKTVPEPVAPTVTLPETLTAGQEITMNGKDFATDAKLVLKNSADETKTLDMESAVFTATSVTFTLPADAEAGTYKVVVRQNDKEYELGTVEVVKEVIEIEKTLAKIVFSDYSGSIVEYVLTYGEDGQIAKIGYVIKSEGDEDQEVIYNVKREGEQITIADDEEAENYIYTLKDGKVTGSNFYDTDYRWEYKEGYLASVIGIYPGEEGEEPEEEVILEYEYTAGKNLEKISGSGLKFGENKNIPNGVDPVICIYKFILTAISENGDFFPHLLGLCGNASVNLPSSLDARNGNLPLTYIYEDWGGIKSITCESEDGNSVITFEYED